MYQNGHSLVFGGNTATLAVDYSAQFEAIKKELRYLPKNMPINAIQYDQIQKMLREEIRMKGRIINNNHKTNRLF